jgi:hypothetical protein
VRVLIGTVHYLLAVIVASRPLQWVRSSYQFRLVMLKKTILYPVTAAPLVSVATGQDTTTFVLERTVDATPVSERGTSTSYIPIDEL